MTAAKPHGRHVEHVQTPADEINLTAKAKADAKHREATGEQPSAPLPPHRLNE